jgi:hypothetical protein
MSLNMNQDVSQRYITAKAVGVSWVLSIFGPLFLSAGITSGSITNICIGAACLLFIIFPAYEGVKLLRKSKLGFAVYTVLPVSFFTGGMGFLLMSSN